jgi:hypothetical protein
MKRKGYHKEITEDLRIRIDSKIINKLKASNNVRHVYHCYNEAWYADSPGMSCTLIITGEISA